MGRKIKRFLGFWLFILGVLLIVGWFISSFMAKEPDLFMGAGFTLLGLPMTVFGWSIWRSSREAKKKDTEWACDECGGEIRKKDKFCSKCGVEFE